MKDKKAGIVSLEELIKNPPKSFQERMLEDIENKLEKSRTMNMADYIEYLRKTGVEDEFLNQFEFLEKRFTPPANMPAREFIEMAFPPSGVENQPRRKQKKEE